MIQNRQQKIERIVTKIRNNISQFNDIFGADGGLYFYKKSLILRNVSENIESFLSEDYNLEILYATLASWGMNSRAAKMKYFDSFKENIRSCLNLLKKLEYFQERHLSNPQELLSTLRETYINLELMQTRGRLVSNSKLLHFLFPEMLMPMDRSHTLVYFYGTKNESIDRYIKIIELSFEIMALDECWERYLDDKWNTTIAKMIDNAIFMSIAESKKA